MSADPDRIPLLVWLGVFIALAAAGATALDLIRHPSPPPVNHCPPSDKSNPWCVR
jgi:hypothetical protein